MSADSKPANTPDPTDLTEAQTRVIELLRHHEALCPSCSYNLRGIQKPACPECGSPVSVESLLQQPTPRSFAWVVALIGLAISLPESFYKWQRLAVRHNIFYGEQRYVGPSKDNPMGYVQIDAALTNGWFLGSMLYWYLIPLAILAWWMLRQRFERLPTWMRWLIATSIIAAAILGHRRTMFWYYWLEGAPQYAPYPFWYLSSP